MKLGLTNGSLFTGFGMMDLGALMKGVLTVWQVEKNPYCQKVLEKNYPNTKKYLDVRSLPYEEMGSVDIISAGFPCQPFSTSGKRRGTKDDRFLWPETIETIERFNPTWVVLENVGGLLSMVESEGPVRVESQKIHRQDDFDYYQTIYSRQAEMLFPGIIEDLENAGRREHIKNLNKALLVLHSPQDSTVDIE
ncbi:MAG: hypothetical protein GY940_31070, partial [bacterium]|nr:hypothetical protein [bacterium]